MNCFSLTCSAHHKVNILNFHDYLLIPFSKVMTSWPVQCKCYRELIFWQTDKERKVILIGSHIPHHHKKEDWNDLLLFLETIKSARGRDLNLSMSQVSHTKMEIMSWVGIEANDQTYYQRGF